MEIKKTVYMLSLFFFLLFLFHQKIEDALFKTEQIAKVLQVDNSDVIVQGVSRVGSQHLEIKVLLGKNKGKIFSAENLLSGSIEYDEFYEKDHTILVAFSQKAETIEVKVLSLLRIHKVMILFTLFTAFLLVYAQKIGLQSLFSFIGSLFILWEYLIPALKSGKNILMITSLSLIFLSALIIFLVAGFTKKASSAFLGTLSGLFVTAFLTFLFGKHFSLDGMHQPLAQSLLFTSYTSINLLDIFYAAIIIGSSGAAMDIAMDMAATIEELKLQNPNITRTSLMKSGFRVGRSVVGTMTTTLLLAYSGGFLTLLLLFSERNITFLQIVNMKIFVPEIIKIIIGSIGLLVVAPMTSYIAAYIYSSNLEIFSNRLLKKGTFYRWRLKYLLKF